MSECKCYEQRCCKQRCYEQKCRKKKCRKKPLDIPYVDVSGELRVERDEFGVPRVIGTPAPGPSHGPGSYYYQVGYLWARADAEDQYTNVVYSGISVQGRAAEFIKGFDVQQDIDTRRSTITKAQIEEQLAMGALIKTL